MISINAGTWASLQVDPVGSILWKTSLDWQVMIFVFYVRRKSLHFYRVFFLSVDQLKTEDSFIELIIMSMSPLSDPNMILFS